MFQLKKPRARYTLGLLAGWPVYGSYAADRFVDYIAQGLNRITTEEDCNLLLGLGVNRLIGERSAHAAWPMLNEDSDFVPIGPLNTDGLIVLSPVRSLARSAFLQEYMSKGFPIVFIGTGGGRPAVMVDNLSGIRLAVGHLIEHGHSRIAFLAGDSNDPGDSLLRLKAYHTVMDEYKIKPDPRLVSYGFHNLEDGYRATAQMLRDGSAFTALLASNDMSAIGAMQAIQEKGLRVPEDIAVIGFDDQPMAAGQEPPLTSVHYPLFEAGYQAGQLLIEALKSGREIGPAEVLLSPRLTIRSSCGCTSSQGRLSPIPVSSAEDKKGFEREPAVQEMVQFISAQVYAMQPDQIRECCNILTSGFLEGMKRENADLFSQALAEVLYVAKKAGENLHVWQEVITILSLAGNPLPDNPKNREFSNLLLQGARVKISESVNHQLEQIQISQNSITHQLSWLSAYLFAAHDESEIMRVLARLPLIGIKFVHVGFFEPQAGDAVAEVRYRIPSAEQGVPAGHEGTGRVLNFPTREFPPPGVFPEDRRYNLAILPLVLQDEALGFVVFESNNLEIYAAIVRELAAAIQSARLHAKVVEMSQTDALTMIYNRRYLEEYLAKELERSRRYRRPLALAMLDLDHFKDYNDAHGHQAGDHMLQEFAGIIQAEIRHNLDIVARYGGEEFVIVMPESDMSSALKVAERIRSKLESIGMPENRLTTSIGVTACSGGQPDPDELINQADKALYLAKNNGRDRVCAYQ